MSDHISSPMQPSLSLTEMDFAELGENGLLSEQAEEGFMSLPLVRNLPSFFLPQQWPKPVSEAEAGKKRRAEMEPSSANHSEREGRSKRREERLKESVRSRSSKEGEKEKEVVHVRARRGQATDSHSLAERVRRERINEKMRCLQDLVPGCYKTMGMATMLDEIINYVQSLQNQVEFLSMKLTAATSFYDFNLDVESVEATQQLGSAHNEAQDIEKLDRYGSLTGFNSALPF